MATASTSRPQGGHADYVFKMQYDAGGPSTINRRYGYSGELALPQVYEGLQERASQAFGIPRENTRICVRDSLGNPHLRLDSYQAFLRHVYMPLQQRPREAKIDEKKRIVLAFVVFDKQELITRLAAREAEIKDLKAQEAARLREKAKAAEAQAKKQKLERQAVLAQAQAKVRAQHASARPAAASAVAASTATKTPRTATPTQPQDSVSKPKVVEATKPAQKASEAIPKPASTPVAEKVCAKPAQPTQGDKAAAWPGVQGLLEAFVENLNAHLADTFGDSAVPLDFTQATAKKARSPDVNTPKSASPEEAEKETAAPLEPPRYHPNVFCDGCSADLYGPRYKCLDCSNYDLCGSCMDQRDSHHAVSHTFAEISFPGAKHQATSRGTRSATITQAAAAPVRHAATCNLCDKTIFGARYKCLECPDFDLDAECFATNVRELHPGHKFVRLQSPRDYVPNVAPPASAPARHRHVRCDGCQREPIVGVRYRCMHPNCPDYDLCADCEALPIAVHPHDHPLLKIRQPLDPWKDRSKVVVARDRARALVARTGNEASEMPSPASAPLETVLRNLGLLSADGSPSASNVQIVDGPGSDTTITADVVLNKLVAAPAGASLSVEGEADAGNRASTNETIPETETRQAPAASPTLALTDTDLLPPAVEEMSAGEAAASAAPSEDGSPAPSDLEDSIDEPAESHLMAASSNARPIRIDETPRATFVSDITLLDGIAVPAGAEFQKVWAIRAGPSGWPAGCRLVHVGGFSSKHFAANASQPSSFEVNAAAPNEVVSVSCDCKAPEDGGRFMDFWRLALPDGTLFGERLWIDLTIESEDLAASSSAHLSASSSSALFMAPSLDAQGKAGPPSSTVASSHSHATSSRAGLSEFESVGSVPAPSDAANSDEDFVFLSGDSSDDDQDF
ncbi:hypothetical protein JCM3774_004016 [Rhodotorula dairenensis]